MCDFITSKIYTQYFKDVTLRDQYHEMSLFSPAAIREEEDEEAVRQVPSFDRSKKPSYNPLSTSIGGWPCVYLVCVCVCVRACFCLLS